MVSVEAPWISRAAFLQLSIDSGSLPAVFAYLIETGKAKTYHESESIIPGERVSGYAEWGTSRGSAALRRISNTPWPESC
jgi:hypothetical protein